MKKLKKEIMPTIKIKICHMWLDQKEKSIWKTIIIKKMLHYLTNCAEK